MTVEEMAKLAMARTSEITSHYPSTRALIYRRLGLRQREIMAMGAKLNPDYYGTCAESALDAKAATDLNDIIEPVPTPELVEMVTIEDAGTSQWDSGREVNIVTRHDIDAELPPRMTLRDLVLQGVGTDLDGVVSVMIFYSRLPALIGPSDADSAIELQSPWDELLAIDGAILLLQKATRLDGALRSAAISDLRAEEAPLLKGYLDHVQAYAPQSTRFIRRPGSR